MKKVLFAILVLSALIVAACNMPQAKAETVLPIFLPTAQNAEIWPVEVSQGFAYKGECGGRQFNFDIIDTSKPNEVTIKAGFVDEPDIVEVHKAPSEFTTLCHNAKIKWDESASIWRLYISPR